MTSLFAAFVNAISKTSLIFDDIPATASNLIAALLNNSHPDTDPSGLPAQRKGKHMSEGEFYRKAAWASLGPKAVIGLGLGAAAGGLGFIGLSGLLTIGLIPLAFWITGKSAEKNEDDDAQANDVAHKPGLTDRLMKLTPGTGKFLKRLPEGHRHILGRTIKMDVALEMEMMTLAAVALGASGLATAGLVGFAATVALVPFVALAATAIVWSTAFGVRKLRYFIAKKEDEGYAAQQKGLFHKFLKLVDKSIEPALGIVGRLALMTIGGGLLIEQGLIPLAHLALPHLAAAVAPVVQAAIHGFEALPGIARLAISAPFGFSVGKFIYNPAKGAFASIAGKIPGRGKKQEKPQPQSAPIAPQAEPAPAGKIHSLGRLGSSFGGDRKTAPFPQGVQAPQTALNPAL